MPAGAVWLGVLEWRSVGGTAQRSRRRRARRPPAWLTLRGWLHGPEDLLHPPRDPVSQPELWDGEGCEDSDVPLFLELLKACTPHLRWLSAELRITPWVLVKRLTLSLDRVFDTAEDFRLPSAAHTLVKAVQSLKREDGRGLLHVTTSPTPLAGKVNPDILLNCLGQVGSPVIPQDIWEQAVPPDLYGQGLQDFDVEAPWVDGRGNARPGPPPWASDELTKFVEVLIRQWLLYDLSEDLPPTCWPFIIPKTSEKVSFILSCVKQNGLGGCTPPEILAAVMGAVK